MGLDRFVRWSPDRPEWGDPTIEKLATIARDFLGPRWTVIVKGAYWFYCESEDHQTFALRSVREDLVKDKSKTFGDALHEDMSKHTRGFEVFHCMTEHTSVITRQADEFTGALADRYAAIIARWWVGKVESS